MSEVKLNLIDYQTILTGEIHGSIADACIAALSAEPETIAELQAALFRYMNDEQPFAWFRTRSEVDCEPHDAGLVIIDLAARVAAAESTYSQLQFEGEIDYHDGTQATDVSVSYRVPVDWHFVNSIEAYRWSCERRREQRQKNPPLDARAILYGAPLLEFIVRSVSSLRESWPGGKEEAIAFSDSSDGQQTHDEESHPFANEIIRTHARWLLTPREELRGQSPRDVLLDKQDFVDFDLHTRSLQWSMRGEGPPCLASDSFAYRFGGFGTQEWVIYYDLVRHLLWSAIEFVGTDDFDKWVRQLEQIKDSWLEQGNRDYDGRIPAIIIHNERRRLPEAMNASQLMIDEDCECCRMMALEAEMGFGPTFWHLDGSHMEEEFAFTPWKTVAEWETENRRRDESYQRFELEWAEREYRRRAEIREWDEEQMRQSALAED